ncbi:hypothetical protein J6590_031775 [Homalodisca vitripennis]|nr:hypothetical protein J6590_031775 [Homalodisca vitripennis]
MWQSGDEVKRYLSIVQKWTETQLEQNVDLCSTTARRINQLARALLYRIPRDVRSPTTLLNVTPQNQYSISRHSLQHRGPLYINNSY